jgi:hypothetical protein
VLLTIRRGSPSKSAAADASRGPNPVRIAILSKRSAPKSLSLSRFFPSSDVTSQSTLTTSRCNSNRYSLQTGFPVTHSKQTAVVLSNRYDPTPLGGSGVLVTPSLDAPHF